MNRDRITGEWIEPERKELMEAPPYRFDLNRRQFVGLLGAGLLITVAPPARAQRRGGGGQRGGGGGGDRPLPERLHIDTLGVITVLTGKVDVGQGSRTQLCQAAAEELRVRPEDIQLIMADSQLCPDDGGTAGSRTTPSTVPAVRRGAAAARQFLIDMAALRWDVRPESLVARDGAVHSADGSRTIAYREIANDSGFFSAFNARRQSGAELTPIAEWTVLGKPVANVLAADIVRGKKTYPSDLRREGMLYGKVLRPPCLNGRLTEIDLGPAQAMEGVVVVRDGDFVGCAAPTLHQAKKAAEAIAPTAKWDCPTQPPSTQLFEYLKANVSGGDGGGFPRPQARMQGDVEAALGSAERVLRAEFHIAYIQHAPMEPRAALAIWTDGKLEVHAGTQQPSRVRGELASAFRIDPADVRLIVPDSGGGFGGKHTGEVAVEAARLAKAAGKPVSLRWTREEEFSFAYFRPAGVIQIAAGLDADGKIVAWDFTNLNSGSSAIATPYSIPNARTEYRACNSPLREGSYRALASTANNFARETMMDELAVLQGEDPVAFRRRSLAPGRLLDVLEAAARRFGWRSRRAAQSGDRAVGIACGTEKGSYVATAVDVEIDRRLGTIRVRDICCAYECGKIQNPENLRSQVEGSLVMGMGGALTESIQFRDGKILNGRFSAYRAPRFEDAPPIECVLLDRPDLDSVGAGETPIVALAPAIASAVRAITGEPVRALPIRLGDSSNGRG